jgi:hypothetical protein
MSWVPPTKERINHQQHQLSIMSSSSSGKQQGTVDDDRSTRSFDSIPSVAQVSLRQHHIEAALSDLESSFEGHSHSARYTSHILDMNHSNHGSDDLHDLSISTHHSSVTAQWLSSRNDPPSPLRDGNHFEVSLPDSSGMVNIWQRQQHLITGLESIDQSVNLMDPSDTNYRGDAVRGSGLEKLDGTQRRESKKGTSSFSFPFLPTGLGDLKQMESEIKRQMQFPHSRHESMRWKWILLLSGFFVIVSVAITVVVVQQQQHKTTHKTPADMEANKNIQQIGYSKSSGENQRSPGVDRDTSNLGRSWDDDVVEFSAVATTTSHDYEVTGDAKASLPIYHASVTLPAKTRARAMLALLLESQVSQPHDILGQNKQSAAYRALKWIANDDPAELPFPTSYYQPPHTAKLSRDDKEEPAWKNDPFAIHQILQRYALAVFFFSLQSQEDLPDIDKFPNDLSAEENYEHLRRSWLTRDHVCHWRGIDCGIYEAARRAGAESIHMSSVVSVDLTRHQLEGTFPREWLSVTALPDLLSIDLSYNLLHGTLPPWPQLEEGNNEYELTTSKAEYILRFSHVTNSSWLSSAPDSSEILHMDLSHNRFKGSLPRWIQNMKHCLTLFLNHNQFAGALETLLGDSTRDGTRLGEFKSPSFSLNKGHSTNRIS